MFDFLKQSILKRYSRQKLSEMYGVNLPDNEAIYEKMKNVKESPVDVNCYEVVNKNGFVKSNGEKCVVTISKEESLLLINARLTWLQKLLLMINLFISGIMGKISAFFEGLITKITSKIPANLINFVTGALKIVMAVIYIPLLILKACANIFYTIKNQMQSNGIAGLLIGLILGILVFFVQVIMIILSALLSPVMDKIVDKIILKDCIKKMIIGHFALSNNFNGTIVVSPSMVTSVSYELKSSLLGKEKLYVVIKESEDKVTFIDRIKSFIVPTYFVNKQTVIVTDVENKSKFEGVFKV